MPIPQRFCFDILNSFLSTVWTFLLLHAMTCFGIAGYTMIPRWLRSLYTSACGSHDLTDWDYGPNDNHRGSYSPPKDVNVPISSVMQGERNDTKIYLGTEPSFCGGYRPNSPGWTDRKMPEFPTPPNSPQAPDSAYLAKAPARPQTPELPEIRMDQPLPTASSCAPSPEGTGDTSVIPSNSK